MPIQDPFILPASAQELSTSNKPFFLAFLSSTDPATQIPWCPDVRAALPIIRTAFGSAEAPEIGFVHVGLKEVWKNPQNVCRTGWNISNIPTVVRYERIGGEVKEAGRLVEAELLDAKKLQALVEGRKE